jgi:hypothetical protein
LCCKSCVRCGISKPYRDFYTDKRYEGGVRHACKECVKIEMRDRRARDVIKARAYGRNYYAANRCKLLRAINDDNATPRGRIDNAVSCGVLRGIRRGSKNGRHSFSLLGYSLDDLMRHLEAQFEPWMTWENYGFYGWHIDHIRPLASFTYDTPDDPQFKEAWALSNLRPLRSVDNWRKGASVPIAANDNADAATTYTDGESDCNWPRQAR